MVDSTERLSRTLADLERRVRSMEVGSQLGRSSLNVNGADVSIADSIRAAISADEKAAQAITDASSALAKADGVVNTYFTADGTPPSETPGVGDFWYRRDTGFSAQWDGTEWRPVTSEAVSDALTAAAAAQSSADGKISTFYSTTTPTNPGVGDIWYQPPANVPRRWSGTAWQLIRDGKIQDALDAAADADKKATTALNSANGRTKVVYSTHAPDVDGVNEGDTWFRIDGTGTVTGQWGWQSGTWTPVTPQSVTVASLDAGKITTGTLAAGVKITAGTPGAQRVEITDNGIVAYNGTGDITFTAGGYGSYSRGSFVADLFQSAGSATGGVSYVMIGNIGDGDTSEGIRLIRPNNSQVTLRNSSDSGGGALDISFRNGSNVNQGGMTFNTNGITAQFSYLTLGAQTPGSISLGYGVSINGGGYNNYHYAAAHYFSTSNGQLSIEPNDGNGNVRVGVYASGIKFLSSSSQVQFRSPYTGSGYGDVKVEGVYYNTGVYQSSNPRFKNNIRPLDLDGLALLEHAGAYAWEWNEETSELKGPGFGFLTTQLPFAATNGDPDSDTYDLSKLLVIAVQAIRQLSARVTALEAPA